MGNDSDLTISIDADPAKAKAGIGEVGNAVDGLTGQFKELGVMAAEAFAVYESIAVPLEAYRKLEQANNEVSASIESVGLDVSALTAQYRDQAEAVGAANNIAQTQILQGQAVMQSLVGQTEISQRLTQAVVDFAAHARIDVVSAFDLVGRAAYGSTAMLTRHGIVINESGDAHARLAEFVEKSSVQFDGQAAAANKSTDGIKQLTLATEELEAAIGSKLAPNVGIVTGAITALEKAVVEGMAEIDKSTSTHAGPIEASFLLIKQAITGTEAVVKQAKVDLATWPSSGLWDYAKETKAARDAMADAAEADRKAREAHRQQAEAASNAVIVAETRKASTQLLAILKDEATTAEKINNDKYSVVRGQLQAHLTQMRAMEDQQRAIDRQKHTTFETQVLADSKKFHQMSAAEQQLFLRQHGQQLEQSIDTEQTAEASAALEKMNQQIASHNLLLQDQARYGTAVAVIDQALHQTQVQDAKAVSSELVGLAQSKNATLKAIGKVASIANITIATAESAVVIAQKVIDALPFPINIPIAAGLSAARIAFGAEQISNVAAANAGGVIPGLGPNEDSQLSFLTPGELVVPRQNFDETVNAVAGSRGGDSGLAAIGQQVIGLLQNIAKNISGGDTFNFNGDVLTDRTFVQSLIRKISDEVRYNNAKLITTPAGA